jgi:probable rRNA maturation factor
MVEVTNRTRKDIPPLPYQRVFQEVFQNRTIDISLVFVGDATMRALNKKWRGKDKTTNVLAFPLEAGVAEIFISPSQALREATNNGVSYQKRLLELFLHGMLHVKGFDHVVESEAEQMEALEQRILSKL